jgi:DNA mismatch endonuclease (patch repair protein)
MKKKPSELRSRIMRAVKSRDTAPEMFVRRLVHRLGYRYRLHRKDLPGKPDLVFPNRKLVIFVHGCFWHGHDCPRGGRVPKTNRLYWRRKVERNRLRDASAISRLAELGWQSLVVWECETRAATTLEKRLRRAIRKRPIIAARTHVP